MTNEFEWDEAKNATNMQKHGVELGEAIRLDWGGAVETIDPRRDYGEVRFIALAPLAGRLHVCVYVLRNGRRRIISLRKANVRETLLYEREKTTD